MLQNILQHTAVCKRIRIYVHRWKPLFERTRQLSLDSIVCVPWLVSSNVCHDSFNYMCAMTHSIICAPWLIQLHMCHDSFICAMTPSYVPWLLHMCHDSFICAMTPSYVPWLLHMCAITRSRVRSISMAKRIYDTKVATKKGTADT